MYEFQNSVSDCFRDACAINMGDSVILTGGYWSYTKVTELRMDGSYTELPELNQGRHIHGCASYVDEHGNKVTLVTFIEATRYSYLKGLVGCWGI